MDGDQVEVRLTLDDPRCPLLEYFVDQIRRKMKSLNGIEKAQVTLLDKRPSSAKQRGKSLTQKGMDNGR